MAAIFTQTDLVVLVRGLEPTRSVFVGRDVRSYAHHGRNAGYIEEYRITLLPGMDGTECQILYADSLDELVARFRRAREAYIANEEVDLTNPA